MTPAQNIFGFAHREVMAPVGLWRRGAEALGYSPTSVPVSSTIGNPPFEQAPEAHRASKAFAISPSGETGLSARSAVEGCAA